MHLQLIEDQRLRYSNHHYPSQTKKLSGIKASDLQGFGDD